MHGSSTLIVHGLLLSFDVIFPSSIDKEFHHGKEKNFLILLMHNFNAKFVALLIAVDNVI